MSSSGVTSHVIGSTLARPMQNSASSPPYKKGHLLIEILAPYFTAYIWKQALSITELILWDRNREAPRLLPAFGWALHQRLASTHNPALKAFFDEVIRFTLMLKLPSPRPNFSWNSHLWFLFSIRDSEKFDKGWSVISEQKGIFKEWSVFQCICRGKLIKEFGSNWQWISRQLQSYIEFDISSLIYFWFDEKNTYDTLFNWLSDNYNSKEKNHKNDALLANHSEIFVHVLKISNNSL